MLNLLKKTLRYICILFCFSTMRWHRSLKSFLGEDKDLFTLLSQYHGCWCPGDVRSQGINSHGIDLVLLEWSSFSTRRVNSLTSGWCGWNATCMIFKQFLGLIYWILPVKLFSCEWQINPLGSGNVWFGVVKKQAVAGTDSFPQRKPALEIVLPNQWLSARLQ